MAPGTESAEHREWREDREHRERVFVWIHDVAQRLAVERPELSPVDCVTRAKDTVSELLKLYPWKVTEPPFSEPQRDTEPPPATPREGRRGSKPNPAMAGGMWPQQGRGSPAAPSRIR